MKAAERSNARLAVVQALYQMEVGGKGLHEVQAEFEAHWIGQEIEGARYLPAEVGFFREVLHGVLEEQRAIDTKIDSALSGGWPLSRIETVMRAILRADPKQGDKGADAALAALALIRLARELGGRR